MVRRLVDAAHRDGATDFEVIADAMRKLRERAGLSEREFALLFRVLRRRVPATPVTEAVKRSALQLCGGDASKAADAGVLAFLNTPTLFSAFLHELDQACAAWLVQVAEEEATAAGYLSRDVSGEAGAGHADRHAQPTLARETPDGRARIAAELARFREHLASQGEHLDDNGQGVDA